MIEEKKSIVFIKNGYCCGHGQIVNRLESYLLRKKIEYKTVPVREASTACFGSKVVCLGPITTLKDVIEGLGLGE